MNTTRRQFLAASLVMLSGCMYSPGAQQTPATATLEVDNRPVTSNR